VKPGVIRTTLVARRRNGATGSRLLEPVSESPSTSENRDGSNGTDPASFVTRESVCQEQPKDDNTVIFDVTDQIDGTLEGASVGSRSPSTPAEQVQLDECCMNAFLKDGSRGLGLHKRLQHSAEFHRSKVPAFIPAKSKPRWGREEEVLMARLESRLRDSGQARKGKGKGILARLVELFGGTRTAESIKSHMRNPGYKNLLASMLKRDQQTDAENANTEQSGEVRKPMTRAAARKEQNHKTSGAGSNKPVVSSDSSVDPNTGTSADVVNADT
jgi:hypothetical protein